ncbi:MAG: type II toxin-antitoxin system RelE/ParE family toxin [Candidatus Aminicenantes bacterium]|nr:type II toxin-antitoxin system RelE/ParE family toxin [Candidatus Aminicenantes bacterium]
MRIRWLQRAVKDLEDIYEYTAAENPIAAGKQVEKIAAYVEFLQDHPGMGRPGRVYGTRELVITKTPYIAAYRVKKNSLEILRILHGSRKWPVRF